MVTRAFIGSPVLARPSGRSGIISWARTPSVPSGGSSPLSAGSRCPRPRVEVACPHQAAKPMVSLRLTGVICKRASALPAGAAMGGSGYASGKRQGETSPQHRYTRRCCMASPAHPPRKRRASGDPALVRVTFTSTRKNESSSFPPQSMSHSCSGSPFGRGRALVGYQSRGPQRPIQGASAPRLPPPRPPAPVRSASGRAPVRARGAPRRRPSCW